MATKTKKFKGLGAGNGLAGPIPKVIDGVTPYYFSGYASPLTYSLEQAMELFWLMEGASAGSGGTWTNIIHPDTRALHPGLPASWTVSTGGASNAKFFTSNGKYQSEEEQYFKPHERANISRGKGQGLLGGQNVLELSSPPGSGYFTYEEPYDGNDGVGSHGVSARWGIFYGGKLAIIKDGTSTAKNRYGIYGSREGLYGGQTSDGYFFSSFNYQRYYYMTPYNPELINPGEADGPVSTISLGAFTLYGWHAQLQGGGGNLGSATIPEKANTPTISGFEKYIIAP